MSDDRIRRIEKMESALDESAKAVRELTAALDAYEAALPQLRRLGEYYASPRWLKDLEADEAGKLPPELKRGVLSEDAVYDLLSDDREALQRMLKLASDALRRPEL